MADQNKSIPGPQTVARLARVHFLYIVAFAVSIMVFHAGNLVTPEVILQRWMAVAGMLVVTTMVWWLGRSGSTSTYVAKLLVYALVVMDIALATFLVYNERGMAGLGVALFAVPVVVSATLASRTALFATATLAATAYGITCIKYFVDFFNEGYKLQLYATIGFYGAMFFVLAGVLSIVLAVNRKK